MKKISLLLALILFIVACAGSSDEMDFAASADIAPQAPPVPQASAPALTEEAFFRASVASDGVWEMEVDEWSADLEFPSEPEPSGGSATFQPTILPAQRLIIRSADMSLRTYYFDETIADIEQIIANRGGFIEDSRMWMDPARHDRSIMLWRAEYTLRVPVGLFDQTNRELSALAQILRFSTSSVDATMEFNDLASRIRIREEELRRVELMLDAATEISDIIDLEARVTGLRLAVDAYRRRMTEIDQLAGFSTIRMMVYEAVEIEEEEIYYPIEEEDSFGTRILGAFSASANFMTTVFTGLAMFLAWVGLPAVLIGGVVFIVYKVLKKFGLLRLPLHKKDV